MYMYMLLCMSLSLSLAPISSRSVAVFFTYLGDGRVDQHAALPGLHEQRHDRPRLVPHPHAPPPLSDDWLHAALLRPPRGRGQPARGAQDVGDGRDAPAAADQEHHGVVLDPQGPRLLHLHPRHHPGRGGPDAGAQVTAAHPRAAAVLLHPLGAGKHTGRPLAPLAVRQVAAPRLGTDARQPHVDPRPVRADRAAVRQAAQARRLPRQLPQAAHLRRRPLGV
mmetsp:Transcript_37543/g.122810  ORF Transcript_37543/g.122810 Transcript_37543/m.122810 type:complete len:222 (-) Transcript_37543:245-910(-)